LLNNRLEEINTELSLNNNLESVNGSEDNKTHLKTTDNLNQYKVNNIDYKEENSIKKLKSQKFNDHDDDDENRSNPYN